jgi:hypothetical protein
VAKMKACRNSAFMNNSEYSLDWFLSSEVLFTRSLPRSRTGRGTGASLPPQQSGFAHNAEGQEWVQYITMENEACQIPLPLLFDISYRLLHFFMNHLNWHVNLFSYQKIQDRSLFRLTCWCDWSIVPKAPQLKLL